MGNKIRGFMGEKERRKDEKTIDIRKGGRDGRSRRRRKNK